MPDIYRVDNVDIDVTYPKQYNPDYHIEDESKADCTFEIEMEGRSWGIKDLTVILKSVYFTYNIMEWKDDDDILVEEVVFDNIGDFNVNVEWSSEFNGQVTINSLDIDLIKKEITVHV